MKSSYGSTTYDPEDHNDGVDDQYIPKREVFTFSAMALLALKTVVIVLAFSGLSIFAVSLSNGDLRFSTSSTTKSTEFEIFAGTERTTYSLLTDDQKLDLFKTFITTYNRNYAHDAEEFNKRFNVFKSNLDVADDRNAKEALSNGTAIHGITKFSDLTSSEFLGTYVTASAGNSTARFLSNSLPVPMKSSSVSPRGDGASSDPTLIYIDHSSTYTTAIKNAGSCAAGWAFAAVQQVESDAIREGILTSSQGLSVQEVLDCSGVSDGCSTGGTIEEAFSHIKKPGGLYYSGDYLYTSSSGETAACADMSGKTHALSIGGTFSLNTDGNDYNAERMVLAHLTETGPVSVCVDATIWSTYVSGTLTNCDSNVINHCVQIVGIYYSSATDSGFYKVRNSWGTDWGISGYGSVQYGSNACGIASTPYYSDPVRSG